MSLLRCQLVSWFPQSATRQESRLWRLACAGGQPTRSALAVRASPARTASAPSSARYSFTTSDPRRVGTSSEVGEWLLEEDAPYHDGPGGELRWNGRGWEQLVEDE
jgi:hypothetical protein